MADKTIASQYKYTVEMAYLDIKKGKTHEIKTECIKFIVIDHQFDNTCMPIIYVSLKLDKALLDDMLENSRTNLIMLALFKYDNLTEYKQQVECFRKKFTYLLPNSKNKNDPIDYNDENEDEHLGNTYTEVNMGLLCVDHINNNKKSFEINAKNNTIYDCIKYCTAHINNMIIEPFSYNDTFDHLIMPVQDSVNRALKWLNNFRAFYYTPYRFYQDFNYTYIISSSGKATDREGELYHSIIIDVKDILDSDANDIGQIANKTSQTYEVPVSYAETDVFDNSISNKSQTVIKGYSSEGSKRRNLINKATYMDEKVRSIRLENDNENMLYNIQARENNQMYCLYFSKADLDTDLFTMNKRISVHNIVRYLDMNGTFQMVRKRELYLREDDTFTMISMINLRRISTEVEI